MSTRLTAGLLALVLLGTGCQSAPITGRQQFLPFPISVENSIGESAWVDTLSQAQADGSLVTSGPRQARVQTIGAAIAEAAKRNPDTHDVAVSYDWQFALIASDQVNAWALPGGKCAVYTGLMNVAQGDDQLAAVMGHEVAHALARHSGERMAQTSVVTLGLTAAQLLSGEMTDEDRALLLASLGIAGQVTVMKFSRDHESEADHIGLLLAADAGYDPRAAVTLWENMAAQGGERPPELLSTHPSEATRIKRLQELMPEAMAIWNQARAQGR